MDEDEPVNTSHDRTPAPGSAIGSALPFVSVILPIRNEIEGLRQLIPDLLGQDYPSSHMELILADGGSTDGSVELARQYAQTSGSRISIIPNPGIRSSAGRNVGIKVATGDIVVFIDGHARVRSRSLISNTVQIFHNTHADCLCRPQPLRGADGNAMSQAIASARASRLGHGRDSLIYDCISTGFVDPKSSGASYRRSVFQQIGHYDEHFDACEDVELNLRLSLNGLIAYTDPRLAVEYEARKTLAALGQQMVRYGRGRMRLAIKHPAERSIGNLLPLFLVCLLLLPLLTLGRGVLHWLTLLPVAFYASAVVLASMSLIIQNRRPGLIRAVVIFPVIHLALGAGIGIELLAFCGLMFKTIRATSLR